RVPGIACCSQQALPASRISRFAAASNSSPRGWLHLNRLVRCSGLKIGGDLRLSSSIRGCSVLLNTGNSTQLPLSPALFLVQGGALTRLALFARAMIYSRTFFGGHPRARGGVLFSS